MLMSPDASFSPGDCQTGKGKSNKTKTELELNSKGKEQRNTCFFRYSTAGGGS